LEVEPSLAVNPTDRRNIVVAWMQDNAVAIAAAATLDGGATWHRLVVPRLTTCSGGKLDHVYDPRLVFGPDVEAGGARVRHFRASPAALSHGTFWATPQAREIAGSARVHGRRAGGLLGGP
jgi:hypothetical protein